MFIILPYYGRIKYTAGGRYGIHNSCTALGIMVSVHSGMISLKVTAYMKRILGNAYRYYRLIFNMIAFVSLIAVIIYESSLPGPSLLHYEGYWTIIPLVMLVLSAILFYAGARNYDMMQFLGFRQILTGKTPKTITESGELNTSGVLKITRHPWYLGTLLLLWSSGFDMPELIGRSILTIYLFTGAWLEERKLIAEFGDKYRSYQKEVSMIFPIRYIKRML